MFRPMRLLLLLMFFLLVSLHGWAQADTHWVNPAGSNEDPYTSYAAGSHEIQPAIDVASPGDTVRVVAGHYDLDTTVILWDSLALVGAGMESTYLRWTRPDHWDMIHAKGYTTIADFNINGEGYTGVVGIYLFPTKQPVEIARCRVYDCDWEIMGSWQIVEVHDCEFVSHAWGVSFAPYQMKSIHHNTFLGTSHALHVETEGDIFNNVFHMDNTISAVTLEDDFGPMSLHNNLFLEGATAVHLLEVSRAYVYNNTIIGTRDEIWGAIDATFYDWGDGAWVVNNIFLDCAGPFLVEGGEFHTPTYYFQYNLVWPPRDPLFNIFEQEHLIIDTIGILFADPMLSTDSNFYLQAGSPSIDSGDPTVLDVDGSRSDLGMYGGPGGLTYAYPEEAPSQPDTLIGQLSGEIVTLDWPPNTESDLAGYQVYRDTYSGFIPTPGNLLSTVSVEFTEYEDTIGEVGSNFYYRLTAVDTVGLESIVSNEVAILATGIFEEPGSTGQVPRTPYIIGSYPNPFNTSTTIEYFIPNIGARPAHVQLIIYDILGRTLVTLIDENVYPGTYHAAWNGRDDDGQAVSSGVYFARLVLWGYEFRSSAKLILQK